MASQADMNRHHLPPQREGFGPWIKCVVFPREGSSSNDHRSTAYGPPTEDWACVRYEAGHGTEFQFDTHKHEAAFLRHHGPESNTFAGEEDLRAVRQDVVEEWHRPTPGFEGCELVLLSERYKGLVGPSTPCEALMRLAGDGVIGAFWHDTVILAARKTAPNEDGSYTWLDLPPEGLRVALGHCCEFSMNNRCRELAVVEPPRENEVLGIRVPPLSSPKNADGTIAFAHVAIHKGHRMFRDDRAAEFRSEASRRMGMTLRLAPAHTSAIDPASKWVGPDKVTPEDGLNRIRLRNQVALNLMRNLDLDDVHEWGVPPLWASFDVGDVIIVREDQKVLEMEDVVDMFLFTNKTFRRAQDSRNAMWNGDWWVPVTTPKQRERMVNDINKWALGSWKRRNLTKGGLTTFKVEGYEFAVRYDRD